MEKALKQIGGTNKGSVFDVIANGVGFDGAIRFWVEALHPQQGVIFGFRFRLQVEDNGVVPANIQHVGATLFPTAVFNGHSSTHLSVSGTIKVTGPLSQTLDKIQTNGMMGVLYDNLTKDFASMDFFLTRGEFSAFGLEKVSDVLALKTHINEGEAVVLSFNGKSGAKGEPVTTKSDDPTAIAGPVDGGVAGEQASAPVDVTVSAFDATKEAMTKAKEAFAKLQAQQESALPKIGEAIAKAAGESPTVALLKKGKAQTGESSAAQAKAAFTKAQEGAAKKVKGVKKAEPFSISPQDLTPPEHAPAAQSGD